MIFEPIIGILCLVSLSLIPFLWSWTLWMIISYFQMFPWGKSIEQGRGDQGNSGILQAELGEPDLGSLPLLRKCPQLVKYIHHELPYGQPHTGFDMLENVYEVSSSLVASLFQVGCFGMSPHLQWPRNNSYMNSPCLLPMPREWRWPGIR